MSDPKNGDIQIDDGVAQALRNLDNAINDARATVFISHYENHVAQWDATFAKLHRVRIVARETADILDGVLEDEAP